VDSSHEDLIDGQMSRQHGRDGFGRPADFDVATGLSPDVKQQGLELLHGDPL
jgi:hypothetical protein